MSNPQLLEQELGQLSEKVDAHDHTLYGKDRESGIVAKVNTMWKIHVWLLCTMSSGVTLLTTLGVQKVFGIHP